MIQPRTILRILTHRKVPLGALVLGLLAACATIPTETVRAGPPYVASQPLGSSALPPWGYDLSAIDASVKPGDDYFDYANGAWLKATSVPPELTGIGYSETIRSRTALQIKSIINSVTRDGVELTDNERRIRNLYDSYLSAGDDNALKEISLDLGRIQSATTHDDIARLMGDASLSLPSPFLIRVDANPNSPGGTIPILRQSGLTLPARSYYLDQDIAFRDTRQRLLTYFTDAFARVGLDLPPERASELLKLETAIAELHWSRERQRLANETNNVTSFPKLRAIAAGFPWAVFAEARGYDPEAEVIVREFSAFPDLADLFVKTPVSLWRTYLTAGYLTVHLPYLDDYLSQPHFDFFGTQIRGQLSRRPREDRALRLVDRELDQAIGEIYVRRFFPEKSKLLMEQMVENIRYAMNLRIEELPWMSPETRVAAQDKLKNMVVKVGYPAVYRDYTGLELSRDNIITNIKRLRGFTHSLNLSRLADPQNNGEWAFAPQTVNAFYRRELNEVFLPAGYIQSPLFDPNADPAVNYGAIGSIIGHEIAHGFDDQGSKHDARGALRNWWQFDDRAAFDVMTEKLVAQYSTYEALPGAFVNGRQTVGENIGDLAGTEIALEAYRLALGRQAAPVLDGFSGVQRFFLGRAQARRFKRTNEALRRRLVSAPHSPMRYRVNGVVRNMDAWYEAFNVQPGDALYLPPEDRVRIW